MNNKIIGLYLDSYTNDLIPLTANSSYYGDYNPPWIGLNNPPWVTTGTFPNGRLLNNKITMLVPGCGPEHIKIEYSNEKLTIEANPPIDSGGIPVTDNFHLPNLDTATTDAVVKNGMLIVNLDFTKPSKTSIPVRLENI